MIQTIMKVILRPFYKYILSNPSFKYSEYYENIQNIFLYNERERMTKAAMYFTSVYKTEGDYLEFGCFSGDTFTAAYHFAQIYDLSKMKFYAFDSFKGLPEIKGIDADGFQHFQKGQFASGINEFNKSIEERGVDLTKVEIIPGWFDDVLNEETKKGLNLKKASVIWVDCDLYSSTVPVLNFIIDYLQEGTILIFDDWFAYRANPDRGEQRAVNEWLERNPQIKVQELYKFGLGNSFIITQL